MNSQHKRNIYPFGDGKPTVGMDDYLIDGQLFHNRAALADQVRQQWHEKGLVILANTGMQHLRELQDWGEVIFEDFTTYEGGSAPRSQWSDKVYGIDDTPTYIDMCYHNEACYLPTFPQCFVIGALAAPAVGAATMVSNNEVTTEALLATSVGQALKEKGIRYIRTMTDKYGDETAVYKHWQDTFYTDSREDAERYAQTQGWDYTWLSNGSLRTSYVVDAFEHHDQLDKDLYFAGLVSHAAFFDQWHPFNTLPDAERPFTMELGDGTPLSDEDIATVYAAYNHIALPVTWQQADVAILDNLRWSHARPAYQLETGEQRIMGVAMGMMKTRVGSRH